MMRTDRFSCTFERFPNLVIYQFNMIFKMHCTDYVRLCKRSKVDLNDNSSKIFDGSIEKIF